MPVSLDRLELTAQIVAAFLTGSQLQADAVPSLIHGVYGALAGTAQGAPESAIQKPAVPIQRSVFANYIVCLEDGRPLKMLKRHLLTGYGMTPGQYRAKWRLPCDYPMVAPNYASRRSEMARAAGLGRKPVASEAEPDLHSAAEPVVQQLPARWARGAKR